MNSDKVVMKHIEDAFCLAEKLYGKKIRRLPVICKKMRGRTMGLVRFLKNVEKSEYIPEHIIINLNFNKKHLKETCYHEVAHVVAGVSAKHGPAWKRVMNDFGYPNAEACTDLNEKPTTILKQPKPIKPKVANAHMDWVRSFKGRPLKRLWHKIMKWFYK